MPAILTLLSQGLGPMLVMSAGYILINATAQNVIQPRLVVTHLNLTPFMSLLSSTFWPLVLGPLGAIIGVPLTMGVHTLLLDTDPTTRWLAAMMTATHAEQVQAEVESCARPPEANEPHGSGRLLPPASGYAQNLPASVSVTARQSPSARCLRRSSAVRRRRESPAAPA